MQSTSTQHIVLSCSLYRRRARTTADCSVGHGGDPAGTPTYPSSIVPIANSWCETNTFTWSLFFVHTHRLPLIQTHTTQYGQLARAIQHIYQHRHTDYVVVRITCFEMSVQHVRNNITNGRRSLFSFSDTIDLVAAMVA